MAKWKLCPTCTDQVLKDVELHVDIEDMEPSWRFRIRAFLAKPLFRLGALIMGAGTLKWTINSGDEHDESEKG